MCLNPIPVDYSIDSDGNYLFDWKHTGIYPRTLYLKCGRCVECEINKTREWATRICLEAKHHDKNCVLTLTYSSEHCPKGLVKKDVQDFLKRLFKNEKLKGVKRFYCGEYGSKRGRPHYHCILFGYRPNDLEYFFSKNGMPFFKSRVIEKTWGNGYILVGDVNYRSAFYCAKYLQKQLSDGYEEKGLVPPFIEMSRRPGIGYKSCPDVNYSIDRVYCNGRYQKVPRYFDKVNFSKEPLLDIVVRTKRRKNMKILPYIEREAIIKKKCIFYSKFTNKTLKYY